MATEEPAPASLGPRYAPEDPTLPKPWKGLIDGSTGVFYYWNPETNVTQYEKPAALPPPLPPGPPPAVSTPKLAPIPAAQHGQQIVQTSQQQGQQVGQQGHLMPQQQGPLFAPLSHQQGSHMAQSGQQHNSQLGQSMQHHGQVPLTQHQMMQHPGQQMPHLAQQLSQQSGQQHAMQQLGQQLPQQRIHQIPQQLGQQTPQNQGSQMAQQFTHQQMQYMAYQQSMLPQGQQSSPQQAQHGGQGQTFANQHDYKPAFPKREEDDFQSRNQIGLSPSQFQQAGASAVQNLTAGTNSAEMPQIGGQTQKLGGTLHNMQQPSSMGQLQPIGTELVHHPHGTRFQNEMNPSTMHNQQSNMPPAGFRMGQENNLHNRGGDEYYHNGYKEGPILGPQQPKLAAIPGARSQQVCTKKRRKVIVLMICLDL